MDFWHSRISTPMGIYTQFVPESQRGAVDRLSDWEPRASEYNKNCKQTQARTEINKC